MQTLRGLHGATNRDSGQSYTDVRNNLMYVGQKQEEQTQMLHRHGEWFARTDHRLTHSGMSVNQSRSDVRPRPLPPVIPSNETNGRWNRPWAGTRLSEMIRRRMRRWVVVFTGMNFQMRPRPELWAIEMLLAGRADMVVVLLLIIDYAS